jgi:hypothetical protein
VELCVLSVPLFFEKQGGLVVVIPVFCESRDRVKIFRHLAISMLAFAACIFEVRANYFIRESALTLSEGSVTVTTIHSYKRTIDDSP